MFSFLQLPSHCPISDLHSFTPWLWPSLPPAHLPSACFGMIFLKHGLDTEHPYKFWIDFLLPHGGNPQTPVAPQTGCMPAIQPSSLFFASPLFCFSQLNVDYERARRTLPVLPDVWAFSLALCLCPEDSPRPPVLNPTHPSSFTSSFKLLIPFLLEPLGLLCHGYLHSHLIFPVNP